MPFCESGPIRIIQTLEKVLASWTSSWAVSCGVLFLSAMRSVTVSFGNSFILL